MRLRYLACIGVEQTTKVEGLVSETGCWPFNFVKYRRKPLASHVLPADSARDTKSHVILPHHLPREAFMCSQRCPKSGLESLENSLGRNEKLLAGIKPMLPQDCVDVAAPQEIHPAAKMFRGAAVRAEDLLIPPPVPQMDRAGTG